MIVYVQKSHSGDVHFIISLLQKRHTVGRHMLRNNAISLVTLQAFLTDVGQAGLVLLVVFFSLGPVSVRYDWGGKAAARPKWPGLFKQ